LAKPGRGFFMTKATACFANKDNFFGRRM